MKVFLTVSFLFKGYILFLSTFLYGVFPKNFCNLLMLKPVLHGKSGVSFLLFYGKVTFLSVTTFVQFNSIQYISTQICIATVNGMLVLHWCASILKIYF